MASFSKTPSKPMAGFTLMEIMVVIIVIAVLASVAGPMIGTITDQGKASATRAQIKNIKTALVNYNNDLGRYPFIGNTQTPANANAADADCLGDSMTNNVLVNNSVGGNFSNLGFAAYNKRWEGPYMDSDPSDFMFDAWDSRIYYRYAKGQIWLHSFGPDGANDFANSLNSGYTGDDIAVSVSKVKF
ncbi:MAG: prepilin-type N-terminal cleavage/methylation domain-containing protein [Candidatus Ozemobacteraceae bacterium]